MENHIMEGSVPDSVPNFTPRDSNPKLLQTVNIVVTPYAKVSTLKAKPETSPLSTSAREHTGKKQKIRTAPGAKDFTKAGLFHCKNGTPYSDLFPSDLEKKYCTFFVSMARNAPSPLRFDNMSILESGKRFLPTTRSKSLSTAMRVRVKKFGLMPRPLQSIRLLFLTSTRTSQGIRLVPRVREPFQYFSECIPWSNIFHISTSSAFIFRHDSTKNCIIYFASPNQANPNSSAVWFTHRFMIV